MLKQIFGIAKAPFTKLPDLLLPHMKIPDPIKFEYVIKVDNELTVSEVAYDFQVEIDDPVKYKVNAILSGGDPILHKEIANIDEQVCALV
jgi:SWI/SNF-related matrix-associated actin-dependent regulator of chromatin subfamily D